MKFIIRKFDDNSILLKRAASKSRLISYEEFFNSLKTDFDTAEYVESVTFENNTICINKIQLQSGIEYQSEVVVGKLLLSDANFSSKLKEFLEYCSFKKAELSENKQPEYEDVVCTYVSYSTVKSLYNRYRKKGKIGKIESAAEAKSIIDICRSKDESLYTYKGTDYGDDPIIKYDSPLTKVLKYTNAASLILTMAFTAIGFSAVTSPSLENSNDKTSAIIVGSLYLGLGSIYFLSSKLLNKAETKGAHRILDKIANKIEDEHFSCELSKSLKKSI